MIDPYLLAIDQGTTSSRVIVFDAQGAIIHVQQKDLTLHYPHKGWVEQNAIDIWDDTCACLKEISKGLGADVTNVAAAGIANQRETTIVWDRETGEPIYNAIVWQDRRTAEYCDDLKASGHEDMIVEKTGLLLDPYFSASKIAWILDHVDGARERAEAGALAFGTVDCYLLWKLSNGDVHATDASNASRTMLFNIKTQQWDDELLSLFNIPRCLLPEVKDNIADYGVISSQYLGAEIPIGGVAGDQQAAMIGQGCFKPGMVKSTYGTGCFALMHIGDVFKASEHRLLTTVAYRIGGKVSYALEGSIFVAGAAVQWLRDGLGLFDEAALSEDIANSVSDTNEVYFVPAFTGLGAPYWRPDARAMISGLSRESSAAHIVRAALEAQGYQSRDLMTAMVADSGVRPETLRIDGGLAANGFMCQFLADILNVRIEVPADVETTAWGAACLAGVSAGVFDDLDEVADAWRVDRVYTPQMDEASRDRFYTGWKDAVARLL